jgi:hypothetical protein
MKTAARLDGAYSRMKGLTIASVARVNQSIFASVFICPFFPSFLEVVIA